MELIWALIPAGPHLAALASPEPASWAVAQAITARLAREPEVCGALGVCDESGALESAGSVENAAARRDAGGRVS